MKQDLATIDIEQRLRQEMEKEQREETLSLTRSEPEIKDNLKIIGNCKVLKKATGKLRDQEDMAR